MLNLRSIAIAFLSSVAALVVVAAFALLVGCAYPHVPPASRDTTTEEALTVTVYSSCTEPSTLTSSDPAIAQREMRADDSWAPNRVASGVLISDRYVLTAAHAVECSILPTVHVVLPDGRVERVIVERDDAMYPDHGKGADIARLELFGAGTFGLGVVPPLTFLHDAIGARDYPCAHTHAGVFCGPLDRMTDTEITFGAITVIGDSGAPVYDHGRLIGIVIEGSETLTRAALVGPYWLEGT